MLDAHPDEQPRGRPAHTPHGHARLAPGGMALCPSTCPPGCETGSSLIPGQWELRLHKPAAGTLGTRAPPGCLAAWPRPRARQGDLLAGAEHLLLRACAGLPPPL